MHKLHVVSSGPLVVLQVLQGLKQQSAMRQPDLLAKCCRLSKAGHRLHIHTSTINLPVTRLQQKPADRDNGNVFYPTTAGKHTLPGILEDTGTSRVLGIAPQPRQSTEHSKLVITAMFLRP